MILYGPRPSGEIVINQRIMCMQEAYDTTKEEYDAKFGNRLDEIDEEIDTLNTLINLEYSHTWADEVVDNPEQKMKDAQERIAKLRTEKYKIMNTEEYQIYQFAMQTIQYRKLVLEEELPFANYRVIEQKEDYKNFKVDPNCEELTNNDLWELGFNGGIVYPEGYGKHNGMLISQHISEQWGDARTQNGTGPLCIDDAIAHNASGSEYLQVYTYMTPDERKMYNYLYEKEGYDAAEKYMYTFKGSSLWNMRKGKYNAQAFLNELSYVTDKDGNKKLDVYSPGNYCKITKENKNSSIRKLYL